MAGYVFWFLLLAGFPRYVQLGFSKVPPSVVSAFEGSLILLDWELASDDLKQPPTYYLRWYFKASSLQIASMQIADSGNAYVNKPKDFETRAWFNSTAVANTSQITIGSNLSSIIFGPLILSDEGEIICEVMLGNLSYSGSVNLVVLVKPSFNDSVLSKVAVATEIAMLDCTVKSKPQATVTWFKDGIMLNSTGRYSMTTQKTSNSWEVRYSLTIKNVSRFDAGLYSCLASTGYANSTQNLTLHVNYPAYITYLPSEVPTVEYGTDVQVICEAHGSPMPLLNWYRNNLQLFNDDNYKISEEIDYTDYDDIIVRSTLVIKLVKNSDFGNYTCVAQNGILGANNNVASKTTQVVITQKPYFLTRPPSEVNVYRGNLITLNCTAQAFPKPSVYWITPTSKNDRIMISPPNVRLDTQKYGVVEVLLTINNSSVEDYGIYYCVANSSGNIIMTNTTVFVKYSPKVLSFPPPIQSFEEFQQCNIECHANSYPGAVIEWFYSSNQGNRTNITQRASLGKLSSVTYEVQYNSSINFSNISREDQGFYYCLIKYESNITEVVFNVTVEYAPTFNIGSIKSPFIRNISDFVNFTCDVTSNPISVIKWFHDGLELVLSKIGYETSVGNFKTSTIKVTNLTAVDSGEYKCVAENQVLGKTKRIEKVQVLNVISLPILTTSSTTRMLEKGSNISLSCDAVGYPAVKTYNWERNGVNLNYSQSTYNIFNFNKSNEGNYSCTPYNDIGAGDTVMHVLLVKALYFITGPICKQKQAELVCECDGEGDPKPSILWSKADNSSLALSNSTVLKIQISSNAIGVYTCMMSNEKGKASLSFNFSNFDVVSMWGDWESCDATCGKAVKSRSRSCYLSPCTADLIEKADCNLSSCPQQAAVQASSWYKDWYIVFWILIPIVLILTIVLCLWLARRRRNKKAVVVPVNRSIPDPPVRSIPTQRDIYLPQVNQLPAVNQGYTADIDVQEIEVEFNEESNIYLENSEYNPNAGNAFYKHYDQAGPPPKPKLSKELTGHENPGYAEIGDELRLFGKMNNSGFV